MLKLKNILESVLTEIDWENNFSDTNATCVSPEQLAADMNKELDRLNFNLKIGKNVGLKTLYIQEVKSRKT